MSRAKFQMLLTLTSVGDIVVVDGRLNSLDIASDVELLDVLVEVLDSRVSKIVVAKDLNSLLDLVGGVDVLNGQDGDGLIVAGVTESDTLVGLKGQIVDVLLRNVQVDGDGEESAAGKAQIVDNTVGCKSENGDCKYTRFFLGSAMLILTNT